MNDTTPSAPVATAQSTAPLASPSLIEQLLIAMMTKMMSGKEAGGGVQQIRTEFDDTMLTLMAYDRV